MDFRFAFKLDLLDYHSSPFRFHAFWFLAIFVQIFRVNHFIFFENFTVKFYTNLFLAGDLKIES
jgi:hypothetical protein